MRRMLKQVQQLVLLGELAQGAQPLGYAKLMLLNLGPGAALLYQRAFSTFDGKAEAAVETHLLLEPWEELVILDRKQYEDWLEGVEDMTAYVETISGAGRSLMKFRALVATPRGQEVIDWPLRLVYDARSFGILEYQHEAA